MKTLTFDVETWSSDLLYDMTPEEFVRLSGYSWGNSDKVCVTTDLEEIRYVIREADFVVGHNIHAFDLTAVFGKHSTEPLEMAFKGKILDSWTHSVLVHPAPRYYVNRKGVNARATKPEESMKWHGLDEQAFQLGVQGKSMELKDLAKEFGGFELIPVDDPRFIEYLEEDVRAARRVMRELLKKGPLDQYACREQLIEAITAQIQRNGWRVDQEVALARVAEQDSKAQQYMSVLVEKYNMPTEGKKPLASKLGKEAIAKALEEVGISLDDLDKTKTGNPSFGGESVAKAAQGKGPEAEELASAIGALAGIRPLAEQALRDVRADGKVHPSITMLQKSARWSTTKPGLTTWTSRGAGTEEKRYFIPNADDEVLVEIDLSNADARIVAAVSGDSNYAKRFEPGSDGHLINAIAAWGERVVLMNEQSKKMYRQMAKPLGHGWSYGGGPKTLSAQAGVELSVAKKFCSGMDKEFHVLVAWQKRVRAEANRFGYVTNDWGRKMPVEKERIYTQAPALIGQNGTREIVCDGLIKMPIWLLKMVVAQVHDALVLSVPREHADKIVEVVKTCLEKTWHPKGVKTLKMHFPVDVGPFASNWEEAGH